MQRKWMPSAGTSPAAKKVGNNVIRRNITVRGVVQGVGFRPFLWRLAHELSLTGWVRNEADRVQIEVQGDPAQVERFEAALSDPASFHAPAFKLPTAAQIETVESQPCEVCIADETDFSIVTSTAQGVSRPVIPADLATCAECLAEIQTVGERRFAYPFTNCTHCGPRWSIVEGLPYDRPLTSMAQFKLCPDCQAEYEDPGDRRFHAQPIACPVCGPKLQLLGDLPATTGRGSFPKELQSAECLSATIEALREGKIVALKGLGGFQLLVNATNEEAVQRLRNRKQRPAKPLAVMLPNLEAARQYCEISDAEAELLTSPAAPIVLLRSLAADPCLAPSLAPGNPELGVMLPYTPLHYLLLAELGFPVVCTSGNLSEEPMATTTAEAIERLGRIADLILTHNRPIVRPVDDSVTRCISTGVQILRRARGYAPRAITLKSAPATEGVILAVGGHLKNTIALKLDDRIIVGSHIGDLESVESIEVHRRAIDDLVGFFGVTPDRIACDLHPDYRSTQIAEELADRWSVPLVRVQHHHAHVAAVAAEHGLSGELFGLAWDGTGFGPDGTVWGGEVLIDQGKDENFERFARLRPFRLPGSDRAIREPRRSAFGLLHEMDPAEAMRRAADWFTPAELGPLTTMLDRQIRSPETTSVGRLFDAVAMLCLTRPSISFEGQAAMELEFLADPNEMTAYRFEITEDRKEMPDASTMPLLIDWQPMLAALLEDLDRGVATPTISARFHNSLADVATELAVRSGHARVILSGGCFLNRRLLESTLCRMTNVGLTVYLPEQFPPGDGSISLGQIAIAVRTRL